MERDGIDVVVFDAMGVLYESADDVGDLLIPYLRKKGCGLSDHEIRDVYLECSLGKMSSAGFWDVAGVRGASDEEYCQSHRLTAGTPALLAELETAGARIACLSNDVSAWSRLLRMRFGLTEFIRDWVVSADIGIRKPDPDAFAALCRRVDTVPSRVLLIDDREANVAGARDAGMQALQFGTPDLSTMEDLRQQFRPW